MRRIGLLLLFPLFCFVVSCDNTNNEKQEVVVIPPPPPAVDSVQLQIAAYQQQLDSTRENISRTLRQLDRLDKQLQDSINGTKVPPQLQEETIHNYKNKLHEVRQVQTALKHWQEQEVKPPDSLTNLQRKAYLEEQIQQLDRLMQETQQVRYEANKVMLESDQEEY